MSNYLHAALEIGTSRTVLAIAESGIGDRLKVICHAEISSAGIRKSQILNLQDAAQSIRTVLREIEKTQAAHDANIEIGNVLLAVTGQQVQFFPAEGTAAIEKGVVCESEVEVATQRAHDVLLPKGRELLDIADQDFEVDNLGGVSDPLGMSGRILKMNSVHIHTDANRLNDAKRAAEEAHLEIKDSVFATTCAADAVLDETERRNGVLVIDLGGGSTGVAAYLDGHFVYGDVIGVGGDHITNDIAHAFQTTNLQAETLKINESSAILGNYDTNNARVHLTGSSVLMDSRTISRRALDTVVNARIKELFTLIRDDLESEGILHRLHAGIVLVGGGSNLADIDVIAEQILGASVRRGRPIHVDGLENEQYPWNYAAIAGTLMYSQRNYEEKPFFGGLLKKFFK